MKTKPQFPPVHNDSPKNNGMLIPARDTVRNKSGRINPMRWTGLWIVLSIFMLPSPLFAACQIIGSTADGGHIISCSVTDWIGIHTGAQSDTITIETGATMSLTQQQTIETTAIANAVTINAGDGLNTVTNYGTVAAEADATAQPANQSASRATANATAVKTGRNVDNICNTSSITSTANAKADSDTINISLSGTGSYRSGTRATATAVGLDAGRGANVITNTGGVTVTSTSESKTPQISLTGTGSTSIIADVTSTATGAGIAGAGEMRQTDTTGNINVTVSSTAETGAAKASVGDFAGASLRITAQGTAHGIDGSADSDQITYAGAISVAATAEAKGSIDMENSATDVDLPGTITSNATAVGIDGGYGADTIRSMSTIDATATAKTTSDNSGASFYAPGVTDITAVSFAQSTGINGGNGAEAITNDGSITSQATATTDVSAFLASFGIEASLETQIKGGADAEAVARGIDGGADNDTIVNNDTITAMGEAKANSVDTLLTFEGFGMFSTPTVATAESYGLDGGSGNDTIDNNNLITSTATSTATATGVSVSSLLQLDIVSDKDTGIRSTAKAYGITGNAGNDTLKNGSVVNASGNATAAALDINVQLIGSSNTDTATVADAYATGMDGGNGRDTIDNNSLLTSAARAKATADSISVSALQVDVHAIGGAKINAQATSTGINGGTDDDALSNARTLSASADTSAVSRDISAEFAGSSRINTTTGAVSTATGLDGGDGADEIKNKSGALLTVDATSAAESIGVDVKFVGLPLQILAWAGVPLTEAGTEVQSTAFGINGGDGNDTITNDATMTITASAEVDTDKISVKLPLSLSAAKSTDAAASAAVESMSVAQSTVSSDHSATNESFLFDTATKATSTVAGLYGGTGDDEITNNGTINVQAVSEADSVSVTASLSFGKGGLMMAVPNIAVADASTGALATAVGINGGDGNDTKIENVHELSAEAVANATSTSIGVDFSGVSSNKSLIIAGTITDAATRAQSFAVGMEGGAGDDKAMITPTSTSDKAIINSGILAARATSDADSASIGLSVTGTGSKADKGLNVGFTYVDGETAAEATAVGMDGGKGSDSLANEASGKITVKAKAESSSASVALTAAGSFSQEWAATAAGAIAVGSTTAIADAVGMEGGADDDTVSNEGKIDTRAIAEADSASVSATLAGSQNGLTVGFTYADHVTTAEATAVGMDGGDGDDAINHACTDPLAVLAKADASSASIGVTVTGATKGTGIAGGAALTDGTTKATTHATGITGGMGDDMILAPGSMTVTAKSDADSASVSVSLGAALGELGLVGGISYADAATTAEATAIGIDGGAGKDKVNDTITGTGTIEVTAKPTASSASISLTAQGVTGTGAAVGIALSDGTTRAVGSATGIAGGNGDDIIKNFGMITARALPDADSASVTVGISAAKEGVAAGGTLADATTTAEATATGIDGGAGKDTIANSGAIKAKAKAEASSASVSVSAQGTMTGAALGVSLADGTTRAVSDAAGIRSGDDNDTVTNSNTIQTKSISDIASASVAVHLAGAETGLTLGVAAADISVTANSNAAGIDAGSGDDTITNTANMITKAKSSLSSASVSVDAGIAVTGAALGVALADGKTTALSSAKGLEGGDGSDSISNQGTNIVRAKSDITAASVGISFKGTGTGLAAGASVVDGENIASATAVGISGGAGSDTKIDNLNRTEVDAIALSTRTNVSVSGNVSLDGVAAGASFANASNTATAVATGIDGGADNDTMTNNAVLTTNATTKATTTAVSVGINVAVFSGVSAGVSMADAETNGYARSMGITGGTGSDTIENRSSGMISGKSDAQATGNVVSVNISTFSFSSADLKTTAEAEYAGIDGGSGADTLTNKGTVDVDAVSNGFGQAAAANLLGYGAADVSVTSTAATTGLAGGEDNDTLLNEKIIKADSNATAYGRSVTVNLAGALFAKGNTTARSSSTGLSGGAGADQMNNSGSVQLTTTSTSDMTGVAVNLLGYSDSDVTSLSEATATGMDGGDGENFVTHYAGGTITATATANADTLAASANLLGAANAYAGSTAKADVAGIAGGIDKDTIRNAGAITLTATAVTDASATAISIIGATDANTKACSNVTTIGINGGNGDNTITNFAEGTITQTATASGKASSYDIQLAGGGSATAGTEATALAKGIQAGSGADTLYNYGSITLTASTSMEASTRSFKLMGAASAKADNTASSTAIGIDAGDGVNSVINGQQSSVSADAVATAIADSIAGTIGVAGVSAKTEAAARATGIKTGAGDDTIYNDGGIQAAAKASTTTVGGSITLASASSEHSDPAAQAVGINSGNGNDTIVNRKTITVGGIDASPMAYADVGNFSANFFSLSSSQFTASAEATGITGEAGNDVLINQGTVTVGNDNWMAQGLTASYSGGFISLLDIASAGAYARTVSSGMDGGDGNDVITNDTAGVITVKATSTADAQGEATTSTFGTNAAFVSSTTKATGTGISGGNGEDTLRNKGTIRVSATTLSSASADSWVGWGEPTADASANATATAVGIDAGAGRTLVTNSGLIDISALSTATSYAIADSDVDNTESDASLHSDATAAGIRTGDEDSSTINESGGSIVVNATAQGSSHSDSDEDADAYAYFTAYATGIKSGQGNNVITNSGEITVVSGHEPIKLFLIEIPDSTSNASSVPSESKSVATAGSAISAGGIEVEDGNNTIRNNGTVRVTATNKVYVLASYPSAHLNHAWAYAGANGAALISDARGISAGNGNNEIESSGNLTVTSIVNALAESHANTTAETNDAQSYAGGTATATGITAEDGQNTITLHGNVTVMSTASAEATAFGEDYGYGYVGNENSAGIIAMAAGIQTGDGTNTIKNYNTLQVDATASASSDGYAHTYSDDTSGKAVANSYAYAVGIGTGDGNNNIINDGVMNVHATASAVASVDVGSTHGNESRYTYNFTKADAVGMQTGSGDDRIRIGAGGSLNVRASAGLYTLGCNSSAATTGINAGQGNNYVENHGVITATSETKYMLFGETTAEAIGIQAGSGNDVVSNYGTINAAQINHSLSLFGMSSESTPGIAITTGAGNDTVTLGEGSTTIGAINLGEGDDTLQFTGTPAAFGNIDPGAGSNTLVFDGAGTLSYSFSGFENAVKRGAGTFTLTDLPAMKSLAITEGTLHLNSNYAMAADSSFGTMINGNGSSGLLSVAGTVSLNGALSVIRGTGYFYNGTTYNIITGNFVDGSFPTVTLPEPTTLLSFNLLQTDDAVQITALVKSFTAFASNPVEKRVAGYLDRIQYEASGDLLNILIHMQNLEPSQFGQAFSSMGSAAYDHFTLISHQGAGLYMSYLQRRMSLMRFYANAEKQEALFKPVLLAMAGPDQDLGQFLATGSLADNPVRHGFWLSGYRRWGDQEEISGFPGYDYRTSAGTFGFDYTFSTRVLMGLSVNVAVTDIDLKNHQGKGDISSLSGALYGSYFTKNAYLEGALSYGMNRYHNQRYVTVGSIDRTARSNHDADVVSAQAGGGYFFNLNGLSLGPMANLRYVYLFEAAFTETGADSLNLIVDRRNTQSLVSELGLRAAYVFKTPYGSLVPELSGALIYDFDIDDRVITASFKGSPNMSFSIAGQDVEQIGATVGAGLTFMTEGGISTSLQYNGEFRNHYQSHGIMGQLRFIF